MDRESYAYWAWYGNPANQVETESTITQEGGTWMNAAALGHLFARQN